MNYLSFYKSFEKPDNSFNETINSNNSFNETINNKENEVKYIYLKKDDVSEIKIINENEIICDGKNYIINEYFNELNSNSGEFLYDSEYGKCKNCGKNKNEYFCKNCYKNLCEKCFEDFKCLENNHTYWYLDDIKKINLDNIKEIKSILNKIIIHIKEDDKLIKIIIQYIDKYLINNNDKDSDKDDNKVNNNNSMSEDLSKLKIIDNQDIILINKIISLDYINFFHYLNIEDILNYLRENYKTKYNNDYKGYGKMIDENGGYYIGEWKDGLRNGKGILFYNTKILMHFFNFIKYEGPGEIENQIYDYYIGEWKDNMRHGKGILQYKNGRKYQGGWVNDKVSGYGKTNYENGDYYAGEWKDGFRHGKGEYTYENGEYYKGEFWNGLRRKGLYYYKNGNTKYDGEFIKDKFDGRGKYFYEDGEYYDGEWKVGLKHGKGIIYYKNGNIKYDGGFVKNKFEGKGKYYYVDGEYYDGEWKAGWRHGKGITYYKDGNVKYDGEFYYGIPIFNCTIKLIIQFINYFIKLI